MIEYAVGSSVAVCCSPVISGRVWKKI